jgi:hypothetical protein
VVRGSLQDALRASTSLWHNFHDTGDLKITLESPTQALAVLRGYEAAAREMCRAVGGYVTEVVATAGTTRDIRTLKLGCTFDGAPYCSWRMNWAA